MPALAFVRSNPIGNDTGTNAPDALVSQYLSAMATHGRGQGELSRRRRRPDALPGRAVPQSTGMCSLSMAQRTASASARL